MAPSVPCRFAKPRSHVSGKHAVIRPG